MTLFGEPGVLPILVMIAAAGLAGMVVLRHLRAYIADMEGPIVPRGVALLVAVGLGSSLLTWFLVSISSDAPSYRPQAPEPEQEAGLSEPSTVGSIDAGKRGGRLGGAEGSENGEALSKGDKLGGAAGSAGRIDRIQIIGSEAFKAAIRESLADIDVRGSAELIAGMLLVRTIRELRRGEGAYGRGGVLAYTPTRPCDVYVYPYGWQTSRIMRTRVIAHESHHCALEREGRPQPNDLMHFKDWERQIAQQIYGETGDGWSGWAGGYGNGGSWRGRPRRTPCPN